MPWLGDQLGVGQRRRRGVRRRGGVVDGRRALVAVVDGRDGEAVALPVRQAVDVDGVRRAGVVVGGAAGHRRRARRAVGVRRGAGERRAGTGRRLQLEHVVAVGTGQLVEREADGVGVDRRGAQAGRGRRRLVVQDEDADGGGVAAVGAADVVTGAQGRLEGGEVRRLARILGAVAVGIEDEGVVAVVEEGEAVGRPTPSRSAAGGDLAALEPVGRPCRSTRRSRRAGPRPPAAGANVIRPLAPNTSVGRSSAPRSTPSSLSASPKTTTTTQSGEGCRR